MINRAIVVALASLFAMSSHAATLYGASSAKFDVKATVDSFVGSAVSEPFVLNDDDASLSVVYTIEKMETGKKKRDTEMFHMFHADEFPTLSGSSPAEAIRSLVPSEAPQILPIQFTMHGVTNEVEGAVSNVEKNGDELSFDVDFPLTLSAFGLKAPSVMMMIRVSDVVKVSSHVTLSASAPESDSEAP